MPAGCLKCIEILFIYLRESSPAMKFRYFISAFEIIWKWLKFSGWLVWFFLSFPWQIQKGYSQFFNATSFKTTKVEYDRWIGMDISPRFHDNLN
jgi:hypothetical protein